MEALVTQAGSALFVCFTLFLPLNIEDQKNYDQLHAFFPWIAQNQDAIPHEFVYDFAHTDADPERQMAYFREDIMLNWHHYNFHVAYPFEWNSLMGPPIDRKGELFYYMHQQTLARYDTGRLSCDLNRTIPFHNLRGPIKEAYFPNFPPLTTGLNYPGRSEFMRLTDLGEIHGGFKISDMEKYRERVLEAIKVGYAINKFGHKVSLANEKGIDHLGAMLQSSTSSLDRKKYGKLHNMGHDLIARVNDPTGKYGLDPGVMELATTTLRDPLFFRWHREIDSIMDLHKVLMGPYTKEELSFSAIQFDNISVIGDRTNLENTLLTYTQELRCILNGGLDFQARIPSAVLFNILQHEEFTYTLNLMVKGNQLVRGVVRIFLAPVLDEYYKPLPLLEQRRLFMEMDKFRVDLKPGFHTLERRSEQSHVTLPTEKAKELLATGHKSAELAEGNKGCGWPHNLLLPKGRPQGMAFDLFAMVTDWERDKTDMNPEQMFGDASSYCGLLNQKYPDRRNLGFPFDRPPQPGSTLESLVASNSNMAKTGVIVYHSLQVVPEGLLIDPNLEPNLILQ